MRQIKFRAKTVNEGEWIYGMTITYGTILRKSKDLFMEVASNKWKGVDKDTLGQFTGLTDSAGKEIYEGDIVKYDDTPYNAYASPYSGEVVFYCGSWRIKTKGYGVEWVYPYLFRDDFANRKTEILGNIHDNPSLIPNQPTEI